MNHIPLRENHGELGFNSTLNNSSTMKSFAEVVSCKLAAMLSAAVVSTVGYVIALADAPNPVLLTPGLLAICAPVDPRFLTTLSTISVVVVVYD